MMLKKDQPEYKNWISMKARCGYAYSSYRDVTICPQWRDFWAFLKDMGKKPTPDHTLERLDRAKGYESDNCTWAIRSDQQVNRAIMKNNKSGYRGVSWRTSRRHWRANICYMGTKIEIGNFKDPKLAARAYNEMAKRLHGRYAQLNDV